MYICQNEHLPEIALARLYVWPNRHFPENVLLRIDTCQIMHLAEWTFFQKPIFQN